MVKILQLEDDPMQVDMYQRWFALEFPELEWDFVTRSPPLEAFADYDAVLIDFRMGNESGGDIAMRLASAYPEKPTAIVSGNPPEYILEEYPQIPRDHVLDKSGIDNFTAAIRELFQKWQLIPD